MFTLVCDRDRGQDPLFPIVPVLFPVLPLVSLSCIVNRPFHPKGSSENLDLFVRMSVESYCDVVMGGYDNIYFGLFSMLQEKKLRFIC